MNTGMDDQLARCKIAEDEKWGVVLEKRIEVEIVSGISEILKFNPMVPTTNITGTSILAEYIIG
jgi:hypothetical protein